MNCPKCGKQNPDDASICGFCNTPLSQESEPKQPVIVKVSKLSIAALILALLSIALFLPPIDFLARLLAKILGVWILIIPLLAVILGIISIIRIEKSGGRITGRNFAIGAILIPILGGLLPVWVVIPRLPRCTAYKMVCGTQLSGIGKACMLYAEDFEDELPRAGGRTSEWAYQIPDWLAETRYQAYGTDLQGNGGYGTITASFYLLVRYAELQPKNFICTGDSGTTIFKPNEYDIKDRDITTLWDFGPEPGRHCSYSYHMPYSPYALTTSSEPNMPVAADRNPWIPSPAGFKSIACFDPDGDKEAIKAGNSLSHKEEGQNVIFIDGHVTFEKYSFCGINDDNIYTYWDGPDIRRGAVPNIKSQPTDRLDSMLVNNILPR